MRLRYGFRSRKRRRETGRQQHTFGYGLSCLPQFLQYFPGCLRKMLPNGRRLENDGVFGLPDNRRDGGFGVRARCGGRPPHSSRNYDSGVVAVSVVGVTPTVGRCG